MSTGFDMQMPLDVFGERKSARKAFVLLRVSLSCFAARAFPLEASALKLYHKRKTEVLQGKKLPETLRNRAVLFTENTASLIIQSNNQGYQFDEYRIGRLKEAFGSYSAEVPIEDLRRWFGEQEWEPGTYNRYKSTLSLIYRLAIENGKAITNPARLLKRKREDNGRVRFLNQFSPAKTEVDYLKPASR